MSRHCSNFYYSAHLNIYRETVQLIFSQLKCALLVSLHPKMRNVHFPGKHEVSPALVQNTKKRKKQKRKTALCDMQLHDVNK